MPSNLCATSIQNCTDQTPIQKIEARIAQMTMEDYSKEKIVLILTGSFCPIHVHHIEMLKAAKECMEKEQGGAGAAMILGGFVSPSHDDYVGEKLKGDALCLNSQERMELCRLQTADSDWIDVDPWEATQSEFYDYHKVTSRLQLFLQEKCQSTLENKMGALLQDQQRRQSLVGHTFGQKTPNSKSVAQMVPQRSGSPESNRNPFNIRVVYICGADFVLRTGAHKLFGGIVVVDRPLGPPSGRRSILLVNTGGHIDVPVSDQMENSEGMEAPPSSSGPTTSVAMTVRERVFQKLTKSYGAQWCESNRNNIWWLPARSSGETGDVSSTRIRKLLTEKGTCEGLLHPAVARRLREKLDSQERP
ncbi:Nicotinamide/nicotinic acid mononucleotide adenylyltransferase 2 [Mortierella claussenii]|nr:Nicotinamide/nicotinic acid mononucleotide adenylyltransferase 2 [Mortierella claussenii]